MKTIKLKIKEGTKKNPVIGIRYPGKKLKRRTLKIIRANSALWANLYDFEVVPFEKGREFMRLIFLWFYPAV